MQSPLVSSAPFLPEASLRFDCRPSWRYVDCGPNFSNSIRIFYWIFFGIHTVSTLLALAYTIFTFCACCGRNAGSRHDRTSLRIFTSFCIAGFCGASLYCYFMTDPAAFGVPTYIVSIGYAVAVESMACSATLVILSWADALDDSRLSVRSKFLPKYRKYYFMVLFERFINGFIFCLSAADIGGSYLALYRIYLAQWSLFTLLLDIAIIYFGIRMRRRLQAIASPLAVARTTRVTFLYIVAATVASVFTAIQCGLEEITNQRPFLWFIFMGAYHSLIMLLTAWFLIGRPHESELMRGATGPSAMKSEASRDRADVSIIANDGSIIPRSLSEQSGSVDDSDASSDSPSSESHQTNESS